MDTESTKKYTLTAEDIRAYVVRGMHQDGISGVYSDDVQLDFKISARGSDLDSAYDKCVAEFQGMEVVVRE